jgi:YHS domain-containing protein
MFSAFIREFLIPLLFFLLLRSVLRSVFAGFRRPVPRGGPSTTPPPARSGGKLYRDPVCGVYVSNDTAVAQNSGGETLYFCSPECRDKYRAR